MSRLTTEKMLKKRKVSFSFTRVPFRSHIEESDRLKFSFFDINVLSVMFGDTPDYRSISFFIMNFLFFITVRKHGSKGKDKKG